MLGNKRCEILMSETIIINKNSSVMWILTKGNSRRMILREMKFIGRSTHSSKVRKPSMCEAVREIEGIIIRDLYHRKLLRCYNFYTISTQIHYYIESEIRSNV